ncbi:hypothetical protein CPB84DRAFT_1767077 [Gymnopilus junonius]|uniref:Uncharacterized protein n=1 Tax=Gymnopilus junonius TaxID=109634 RepID=A0A9P5NWC2_GYMJU|nr:hypothetical protein CPB84DRAFT_1767077 [Gymnopilus junonius]
MPSSSPRLAKLSVSIYLMHCGTARMLRCYLMDKFRNLGSNVLPVSYISSPGDLTFEIPACKETKTWTKWQLKQFGIPRQERT